MPSELLDCSPTVGHSFRGHDLTLTIRSGGQTGVDRAAHDVALALGLPVVGWIPKGRLAEDGPLHARYPLTETPNSDYYQRTTWNVRDADATLILCRGPLEGGTEFTAKEAKRLHKPCLVVSLESDLAATPAAARDWLTENGVAVLNVAGPRESKQPGIHAQAQAYLEELLA